MDVERFVDTSGSVPTVKVGVLATTLVGTVVYGWFYGAIEFVYAIGGGIASIPERLGGFSIAVVEGVFGMFTEPVAAAWESHAVWIGGLGWAGIIVAVLEVAIVMWIVLLVVERTIRWIRVVTP